ncbi:Sporulation kinase E [Anatilimnocola aggregata]|uniref:histidine kinase n=1 Tax=Anatilimnocola aggregata TaxID=2528021 RepID=A0A517Y7U3_9BACT|nr:ATP-binding protein [Anatilimnocola aggregata]QDU26212.1 Sporulation kinase E [Anatilimnocola aggregata]
MKRFQPGAKLTTARVFVVDDDEDTRNNLRDILELDGYEIEDASCISQLFALPGWDTVSLILLDRKLPDGTPEDVLPQIKQKAPQASVIIITGYADVAAAVSALRMGAADYIIKPVNAGALRASLRRELEHQQSERQLGALFENALDGLVIFDRQGHIVDANPAACSILGTSREQLLDQDLQSPLTCSAFDPAMQGSLCKPANLRGESRLKCHNGNEVQVEHQVTYDFSPGLNLISIRDVTDRKRSEQRALQAERLAAIGETMTALAHESRNALQRGSACLEMLALEVEDRPVALDLVARAQKAQQQLRQLYEEVRQWAAPINLQLQAVELCDVWREAWHQVTQVHLGKRLKLVEFVESKSNCRIDPNKFSQVFRNIFENAVEVSPDAGVIELKCKVNEAKELTVSILDHGPGLSAEQAVRLFEPFFTTKTKGTGLGLAIAKRLIQAHAGEISASSPGGACIEITIPRGMV